MVKARRRFKAAATLAFALALGSTNVPSAHATVMREVPLESLVRDSDLIVRGTVERVGVRLEVSGPTAEPHTVVLLRVREWLKGAGDDVVRIEELGGTTPQGIGTWIDGTPRYRAGEDVVVFLRRTDDGSLRTYAMCQGHFEVRHGVGEATDVVVRDLSAIGLASWERGPMTVSEGGRRAMPLEAFLDYVRDTAAQVATLPGGSGASTQSLGGRR